MGRAAWSDGAATISHLGTATDPGTTKPGTTKPGTTRTGTTFFEYYQAKNDKAWNDH
jgi:hypothetical protein